MSSLTKVVKSIAVVDDRPAAREPAFRFEASMPQAGIIKRGAVGATVAPAQECYPNKQGYLDEINRLKVEIAEAKTELRRLGRQIGEAEETARREEESAEAAARREGLTRDEAEAIVARAREQAEQIAADTEAECAALQEQAQNEGYLQGFNEGFEQARREFQNENNPRAKAIEELLDRLSDYEQEKIRRTESDLVRLTVAIAEKVVGKALKEDPKLIAAMLHNVLDQNRREEYIRVTLSPDLMPLEAKVGQETRQLIEGIHPGIAVAVDRDAAPFTVTVETGKGITDISVSTQLNNIGAALLETRAG